MNALPNTDTVWRELIRAGADRRHPWRVVTFCTQRRDGPAARSVILRQVQADARRLTFYTDRRSQKVGDIAACPQVALLMWDPQHRRQLRIEGVAAVETDPETVVQHWQRVPEAAQRDYASAAPPGAPLTEGSEGDGHWNLDAAREHFTVLQVLVNAMEWLELARERHQRVALRWDDSAKAWQEQALVP